MKYEDLDKHFTAPKKGSYYNCTRIPRKLKKKWNKIATNKLLTINQRLWEILGEENPNYKSFLIKQICK